MNQPPTPPPVWPTQDDEQKLALLSILFYVYSAFVALAALLCVAGVVAVLAFLPELPRAKGAPDPALFGAAFAISFGVAALLLVAKTALMILTGRAFGRRQGYVLCMVGACLSMTNIPLGTALGIFAIVTLQKPGVKARLSAPAAGG